MTLCVASVTRCRVCNPLRVDHGEPPGLVHESVSISMKSWRAQGARGLEPLLGTFALGVFVPAETRDCNNFLFLSSLELLS